MFFNQYPYLNLNDLNLDYILKAIGEMKFEVTNFVSINAIKYADPIQWNITSQYEKNTIVIDPVTGTAYISVAPVPAGVALTRPEYWSVVFDLGSFVTRAAQNFTSKWESETTTTATFSSNMGDWLVWGDVLYKALTNITAGDTYVVGSNIEHFTIEDLYNAYLNTVAMILSMIGDLADLTTTDTSDIVHAINSVLTDLTNTIGDLSTLQTSDISSIVNAINSLVGANINTYDNVAGVIADTDLEEGDFVTTLGYYSAGDYGAAFYLIVSSGVHQITLANGLYGRLINDGTANIAQYGAKTDDGALTKTAFDTMLSEYVRTIIVPPARYEITGTVSIMTPVQICGASHFFSKLVQTDITADMFKIGDAGTNVEVDFRDLHLWNDENATVSPDTDAGTGTGASNKCINGVQCKNSSFMNLKINRFQYGIYIAANNWTIEVNMCKFHSNDYGLYVGALCQAVDVVECDCDGDVNGIWFNSGIGQQIIDKPQIENCYLGIIKQLGGDLVVRDGYFDNNRLRSMSFTGALNMILIDSCKFLENSITSHMIDATGMTAGTIEFRNNSVSATASTYLVNGTTPIKYNVRNTLLGGADFCANVTNIVTPIYDNTFVDYDYLGEVAGNVANSPIKLKARHLQWLYAAGGFNADYTVDLTDCNAMPMNSVIYCKTFVPASHSVSFSGATFNRPTFTNSDANGHHYLLMFIKTGAGAAWDIWVFKSE